MHLFVQACILGLLTGGVYALMASGLALAFGVMRVINVAQGALIILGAYLSYTLYKDIGLDPFVALIVLTPAMFALGIEGVLIVAYQTSYRSTITSYADRSWSIFAYHVSVARSFAFVASAVVL